MNTTRAVNLKYLPHLIRMTRHPIEMPWPALLTWSPKPSQPAYLPFRILPQSVIWPRLNTQKAPSGFTGWEGWVQPLGKEGCFVMHVGRHSMTKVLSKFIIMLFTWRSNTDAPLKVATWSSAPSEAGIATAQTLILASTCPCYEITETKI